MLPDQAVVCGALAVIDESQETITNPKVIFEVLSPSTEDNDRAAKFDLYRLLPSFEEYVLIAQQRAAVEVRRKRPDGRWVLTFYEGLDSVVKLESLDIELPLGELYEGVVLDPEPTP